MSAAHIPPNWRIAETVRPGVRIGEMIFFTGTFPDEEGIAIANLIAAAPELLEALNKINDWACFASEEDIAARLMALQQIGVHARAAIAKATGAPPL